MSIRDIFDYFGSTFVKEEDGEITIGGIDISKFLTDVNEIWKNKRVPDNMFKQIRKYRIVFDSFFAPDVDYQLEQIALLRKRKSHKFRIDEARKQLLENTWLKSTAEDHPDILDFSQLSRLKFTLLPTQMETLQAYNTKVPKMQLKGFLLGTPPGCVAGDTTITFRRHDQDFVLDIESAYAHFNSYSSGGDNWYLTPTHVRSFDGAKFVYHPIHSVSHCGFQEVYLVTLADGR